MQRATPKGGPCEFWLTELDWNQVPADWWAGGRCQATASDP